MEKDFYDLLDTVRREVPLVERLRGIPSMSGSYPILKRNWPRVEYMVQTSGRKLTVSNG